MADRDRERNQDWAEQVPWERPRTPYREFGWEPGESVLPEFRDPSVHVMPYERQRVSRWRREGEDMFVAGDWMRPGPYSGMGPQGYHRSDERIFEDVCERLTQHGMIDASQIDVKVEKGEVILDGKVKNRREKRLAEDIADTVTGVQDVQNRLKITHEETQNQNRIDRVGESGVYPASGPMPKGKAKAQGMASWGQGERGAAGYNDSGQSELPMKEGEEEKTWKSTRRSTKKNQQT